MSRDIYLEKYIGLLERNASRAEKDLERERKRIDFLDGKIERLELVVLASKNETGREYVDRTDRAAAPLPRKPPIAAVRAEVQTKPKFTDVRESWNSLTAEEQDKAIAEGNFKVEEKGKPV
jgi:hypothetical protein